jgi:subtilisin
MARLLGVLFVLAMLAPGIAAAAARSEKGVENSLIVVFKPGVGALELDQVLQAQGLTAVDRIPGLNVVLAEAPAGRVAAASAGLAQNPKVLMFGRDVWRSWIDAAPVSFQETPMPGVETVLQSLPKLKAGSAAPVRRADSEIQWGVARVNAPAAWPTNQGAGVKVAVIDTGIDPNNSELTVAGGMNAIDEKAPWADDHFHGTHVAGIIAAALNGQKTVGVAPKASLYAVKVLTKEGKGDMFAIMKGIDWCAQNGIKVANMSLGAPQEMPLIQYALQSAVSAGVTVIAAAGNDGKTVNWPAAYPETIAVSALCPPGITETKLCPNALEGIATFSSRGPQVAFIAPGVKIPSTVPVSNDPSGVHAYSGTSMATPHVAGLAALAVARGASGLNGVRAALTAAAVKLPGLSGDEQGAGLIDAARFK